MSDDMSMSGAETGVPGTPEKKQGFLSTSGGKVVAILVGLGVLGIIAGVAAAIVLYVFGSQAVDQLEDAVQQVTTSETTGTTAPSTGDVVARAPAAEVANSELFTFRDIFQPLLHEQTTRTGTTTTGGTSSPTDTVTPTTSGVLYLTNIVTEGGVAKAVFSYNNQTYTLGAGESIPGTPWKVLRVSSTSVTMLYGDVQITLSIGQGRAK